MAARAHDPAATQGAALITIGGIIIHVYMGVFLVPGGLGAITTGYVTRGWAKAHHALWYRQVAGGSE